MPDAAAPETSLLTLAENQFYSLSEAELRLLEALPQGDVSHSGLDEWDAPENDPTQAAERDPDRVVRAELFGVALH
jgi:hypothetical protein